MKKETFAVIPRESEKELSGGLLHSIAIGLLFLSTLFVLSAWMVFHVLIWRALIFGASVSVICGLVIWLIHKGQKRFAGLTLVAFLWLMVSFGAYTAGGVNAPIFVGYAAVIVIAALVLGMRTGTVVIILTAGFGGFLAYAEANSLLPEHFDYPPIARLFIYIFFFFVIILIQKTAVDTTSKAIERASASESQYRTFLENIASVTYINDLSPDVLTTYVSPQVKNILGYTQEEFMTNPSLWMEILFAEDHERVFHESKRTSETGEPFSMEYRVVAKDRRVVWVRDEATLVRNEMGQPQYWLGVWTDITNSKNSESAQLDTLDALLRRTNQLQTASEVSSAATSILELSELLPKVVELIRSHFDYYYVGIFLVDEKREMAVLRAATGEAGKQLLAAQHALEVGNTSMIGWCVANDRARIALDVGKEAIRFKNPVLPLSRSELALPLRARGQVIGAMTIQSVVEAAFTDADITALQTMADQVGNAIETARLFDERSSLINELEAKNAELERFSYTVSHDLKSPLVTIRGFVGYLWEDAKKGDLTRFEKDMQRVVNAAEVMQNLLNDLLELSRVGRVINSLEDIKFGEIVMETFNLILSPPLREKIKFEVQEDMPAIHCDRIRIVEVLQNLVSNSIKFMGDQPEPHIQIGFAGRDDVKGYPIFFVKDNGSGIEPQHHERVFNLFSRLNPEMEGTGIGLAIVKRVIEVHGGRIWLESQGVNKGSTFFFTLPPAE
ncbi:ATP-binding protein [Candidatus Villigracilis affinis]|uniref:sensor histidine kinase n=1 Tax=Candidatus Villigracilis affinis TaxID=3140682 RepID=UPI001D518479|nr:PAS domain-containing protein [Anaerolineales bacterium]